MLNVMITLFCALTILSLNHCHELPSKIEVETSINRTVDEVEKLMRQNTTLPHLSRNEIVDILFNITSKDVEAYQNKEMMEEARKIYQRALMVVLPYNEEDAKGNISDLYAKPPIVQIITDPSSSPDLKAWRNKKLEPYTQETEREKEPLGNLVVTHASEKTTKTRYKNHKETYSELETKMPLKEIAKLDSAPTKFSFNLENLQKQSTTEEPETTRRPVYQRPSSYSVKNKNVSAIYSTSTTTDRTTTTSSKDTSTIGLKKLRTSASPPLNHNGNVLSIDQWRYNAPTSATQNPTTSPKTADSPSPTVSKRLPYLSIIKMPKDVIAPTVISKTKDASRIVKVTSGKMQVANTEQSVSIYVTPTSSSFSSSSSSSPSTPSPSEKPKYSSTYNLNSGGFRTITTTTMRPEVMDLLASIGLRPENATNVEEVFKKSKVDLEISSRIPDSGGVSHSTSGLTTADLPSVTAQNAFGNVPEIGKGMSNLTPDVRLLFQRFGLQTSGNTVAASTTSTSAPRSTTNTYTNFKPLPTSKIKDRDMKEFLAQFGLGINEGVRQKKSMPASTERPSLIEAVPSNMRRILENIGLISRTTPRTTTTTTTTTTKTPTTITAPKTENVKPTELTSSMFHVFKPHEVRVKDERQRKKINELLDTIRLVQEGKANATDVRRVANELLATTKTLREGPDPLSLEEIIRIYNEDVKNEVKREQSSPETTPTITDSDPDVATNSTSMLTESIDASSTTTSTTTTTASDSAKDSSDLFGTLTPTSSTTAATNLVALEESFGGITSEPDPVVPTKRKNGLYFLVDWNTFLEVGEENNEKVNLRFQPKVGDRSRFLPVTVP
ncbi:mucin-5AC [Ooceraea biroi]|nr:mucin-5AC [Ooceraea biroi]